MNFVKAPFSNFINWTTMATTSRAFSALSNLRNKPIKQSADEFSIQLNGEFATVTYEKINDNVYDLVHSSIPDEYHGQGLGSVLAERIFQHLIAKNKRFKLTCEFLNHVYLNNKEKYAEFVVDED